MERLEWRHLGPYRGGRVIAVSGHPTERHVYWFGSTGGGVWKTHDAGQNWENVSDGHFRRASVGAIAVAPSDPNVVYVGMGESTIRNTASHGDGVYRSTDGGASWKHLGLADTRAIGKVRIHPRDPDTVFVAALGHPNGPNAERGLFRSRDGGRAWRKVLDRGDRAGAVDLSIDPSNPRILYASAWETARLAWGLTSGGPGSGLFRSTDGGDTWAEISRAPGFPTGLLGKIGVVASPAQAGRIWAIVEAEAGGLYRSDDGGDSWVLASAEAGLWGRCFYYMHVVADPVDPETIWVLNTDLFRSTDAGRTFHRVATPHGDNHDLWIDPLDTRRMIVGCDGGAAVTFNEGVSWSSIHNQPTAELYHLATDTREPYHVYAAQQDCGTIALPIRTMIGAITDHEAREVGGGESGQIAVRPDDPDIVFAGNIGGYLTRFDARTGQARNVEVWPAPATTSAGGAATRHRFTWSAPVALSPHDPNVLYSAGERVFRSTDEGVTWRAISPDLTRRDPRGMAPAAGPITRDRPAGDRDQVCTIFAFAESPARAGVLWAGSDDGFVHVSRDAGKSWTNVTPNSFAAWTLVTTIEPSPHDPAAAYLTASRYLLDDFRPIILRTRNYGRTWTSIVSGVGADEPTRVVREDPGKRGLLFAGTETGAYVSFDDGAAWHRFDGGLPVVPVHDLRVTDEDLVLATHGRGFWIVDDMTALRDSFDTVAAGRAPHLFAPRRVTHFQLAGRYFKPPIPGHNYRIDGATTLDWTPLVRPGELTERFHGAARNPSDGAVVRYYLPKAAVDLRLVFLDRTGRIVRSFTSRDGAPEPNPPRTAGLNRFVWDTRHPSPVAIQGGIGDRRARAVTGPLVAPGRYEARLVVDGRTVASFFEIRGDPRTGVAAADLEAQESLLLRLRDATSDAHELVNEVRAIGERLAAAGLLGAGRGGRPPAALVRRLEAIAREIAPPPGGEVFGDPPKLSSQLTALSGKVANAEAAPTKAAEQLAALLSRRVRALRERATVAGRGLAPFLGPARPSVGPGGRSRTRPSRTHGASAP